MLQLGHPLPDLRDLDLVHAPDAAPVELVPDGPDVPVHAHTHLHLLLPGAVIVILDRELPGEGEASGDEPVRALLHLQLEGLVLQDAGPGGRLLSLGAPLSEGDI